MVVCTRQDRRVEVHVIQPALPDTVATAGALLRKPSSPDKNLPQSWQQADLAFLRCLDFVQSSKHTLGRWFVPCADELPPGRPIVVFGHAGRSWV